jgi:hypothetical protein
MSTPSIVRAEHRGHLIEVTLSQEPDGRWQADWAVFQTEPFVAVAAGVLPSPAPDPNAAQRVATRAAIAWIDVAPLLATR